MATTKTLLPAAYQTLLDIDGDAIANGTVTFKVTGTAVLAVVYADADGLVISANPLTVDAAGRYSVWLTPGDVVDIEYRDALGTLLKTVPGVMGSAGAAGNVDVTGVLGEAVAYGQTVYLSDGSGGRTAGQWWLGNSGQLQGCQSTVGLALAAGAAGATIAIRTAGRVTGLSGLVVGARYYTSATPGALALNPTIYALRLVGQADSTTSLIVTANPFDMGTYVEFLNTGGVVTQLVLVGPGREVFLRGGSLWTVHGIKAGYHGQRVRITGGGAQADFVHNSASAAVNDRLLNFVSSGPTSIAATGAGGVGYVEYIWDATAQGASGGGWRLIGHEQGGWITPAFAANVYSGSGTMTWTVTAGQQLQRKYYLQGRMLRVHLRVNAATIGGTPDVFLYMVIPGSYASAGNVTAPIVAGNPTLPPASSVPCWTPSSNSIVFMARQDGGVPWAAGGITIGADLALDVT